MRGAVMLCAMALVAACGGADDDDAGASGGQSGGGGAGPRTDAGSGAFDPRSDYLRREEDLIERYCRAVTTCCTNDQLGAVRYPSFLSVGVELDDERPTVENCQSWLGDRFRDMREWDLYVGAGRATYDAAAYARCEEKVAALERCDGEPVFEYGQACPFFAVGTGREGELCGLENLLDDTPDAACAPEFWCRRGAPGEEPARSCTPYAAPRSECEAITQVRCAAPTFCNGLEQTCTPAAPVGGDCANTLCETGGRCIVNDCPPEARDCPGWICAPVDLACRGR